MGLWLEQRDDNGKLIASGRFQGGTVDLGEGRVYTIDQVRQLCRFSSHLPLEKRDWVLRIKSGLDDLLATEIC